jgi:hypothetical protein
MPNEKEKTENSNKAEPNEAVKLSCWLGHLPYTRTFKTHFVFSFFKDYLVFNSNRINNAFCIFFIFGVN